MVLLVAWMFRLAAEVHEPHPKISLLAGSPSRIFQPLSCFSLAFVPCLIQYSTAKRNQYVSEAGNQFNRQWC